jgi:hypothetical protein
LKPLLSVGSLEIVDKTAPEYWGLAASDFRAMILSFDAWFRRRLPMTTDVSFDSWWDDDETQRSKKVVRAVGVGNEIQLIVGLRNRYTFDIELAKATLIADEETTEKPCEIETITSRNIPGSTSELMKVCFKFVANQPGRFTVNRIVKN